MTPNSQELKRLVESALESALPSSSLPGNVTLNDAVRAAVFPGGKRFRPIFTLLAAHASSIPPAKALDAACAIELLHCSSLIFDDLPCMDDAGLRRNRPALHRQYGESTALLAGLALFNEAYRLFGRYPRLIAEAAACIGVDGMIGGQHVDVGNHSACNNPSDIRSRDCKTSGLLRLTLVAGACTGDDVPDFTIDLLADCGERLGRSYQILDDLLDDSAETGKTPAQDARHNRKAHTDEGDLAIADVDRCCAELTAAFGINAAPLVVAVRSVFSHVAQTNLVGV